MMKIPYTVGLLHISYYTTIVAYADYHIWSSSRVYILYTRGIDQGLNSHPSRAVENVHIGIYV